jgi:glucose repression mediator protein
MTNTAVAGAASNKAAVSGSSAAPAAGSTDDGTLQITTSQTAVTPNVHVMHEQNWLHLGALARGLDDSDRALAAFEAAYRANPMSVAAVTGMALVLMSREQWLPAAELWQRLLTMEGSRMETWTELSLCWLGVDDVAKALQCLQKAAGLNEGGGEVGVPTFWWAMGLYYDRLGNEEAALESFARFVQLEAASSVPVNDRTIEAYYRLGVLYRFRAQYALARECLQFVRKKLRGLLSTMSLGLTLFDVALQLIQTDEGEAVEGAEHGDLTGSSPANESLLQGVKVTKGALEKLLVELSASPAASNAHPTPMSTPLVRLRTQLLSRVRQRLGCLALQLPASGLFGADDCGALGMLLRATEEDPQDALNWYYTGRLYAQMSQPTKAYDAYQQAVYRDGRNAAFWNSIGNLYFHLGQFRDALDAYTRAVHHAPGIAATWWNLGLLYEACNQQTEDAKEAFTKAGELVREELARGGAVAEGSASVATKPSALRRLDVRISERLAFYSGHNNAASHASANSAASTAYSELASKTVDLDAQRFVVRLAGGQFSRRARLASMTAATPAAASTAAAVPVGYMRRGPGVGGGPMAASGGARYNLPPVASHPQHPIQLHPQQQHSHQQQLQAQQQHFRYQPRS